MDGGLHSAAAGGAVLAELVLATGEPVSPCARGRYMDSMMMI
jgi:hypothetical protein